MANDIPKNMKYTRIGVDGPIEVNGYLSRSSVIDSFRRTFTTDSQTEQGDYFMSRSTDLLEKYLQLMLRDDKDSIWDSFTKARDLKYDLHSIGYSGSWFRRFFDAREYRRLSKETYKIVKFASDRARQDPLVEQLAKATQAHGGQPGSGPSTASRTRDPFTDSNAVSTLSEGNVNDRDGVEMLTYPEGATNGRDRSDIHVTFAGDRTGASQSTASAPATPGLHQEHHPR